MLQADWMQYQLGSYREGATESPMSYKALRRALCKVLHSHLRTRLCYCTICASMLLHLLSHQGASNNCSGFFFSQTALKLLFRGFLFVFKWTGIFILAKYEVFINLGTSVNLMNQCGYAPIESLKRHVISCMFHNQAYCLLQ